MSSQRYALDPRRVTFQNFDRLAVSRRPKPDRPVAARRNQDCPAWVECQSRDGTGVARDGTDQLTVRKAEEQDLPVGPADRQLAPVGAKGQRKDLARRRRRLV